MTYTNFIPTFWSEKIQRENERACVAAQLCNREFEGEINDKGDTVKILGVTRPTVAPYTKGVTTVTPENLTGADTNLVIDTAEYFAFDIDDIDKRQAVGGLMTAQMAEAAAAMAESADDYIYGKYAGAATTVACTGITSATIYAKIIEGLKTLWSYNVPKNEKISLEVSPAFLEKLLLADINLKTDNTSTVDKGYVGIFSRFGIDVYMSNGIYNDLTYDYCFLRTKKAIAFAEQINKVEAYRPESAFSDAVKGLHLYGAKVVRPKELVILKASYGAEQ